MTLRVATKWIVVDMQDSANDTRDAKASINNQDGRATKRRIDWDDPEVPIGDAPSLPRWPLALTGLAWVAWVVFLIVVAVGRPSGTH